jgi:hypothetical protein
MDASRLVPIAPDSFARFLCTAQTYVFSVYPMEWTLLTPTERQSRAIYPHSITVCNTRRAIKFSFFAVDRSVSDIETKQQSYVVLCRTHGHFINDMIFCCSWRNYNAAICRPSMFPVALKSRAVFPFSVTQIFKSCLNQIEGKCK